MKDVYLIVEVLNEKMMSHKRKPLKEIFLKRFYLIFKDKFVNIETFPRNLNLISAKT